MRANKDSSVLTYIGDTSPPVHVNHYLKDHFFPFLFCFEKLPTCNKLKHTDLCAFDNRRVERVGREETREGKGEAEIERWQAEERAVKYLLPC